MSGTGIQTALKGGGQTSPHITVPNGTLVSDSATILGPNPGSASGTVTYSVFSDAQCTSLYASGGTKTVTGGVVPDSDPVALNAAGTFYWQAFYSGDATHNAATTACGDETAVVVASTGSITIVKDAVPNGPTDFAFTTTGSGLSPFSLDDDADATLPSSTTFSGLLPGSFSVTEGAVAGWALTGLTCSDGWVRRHLDRDGDDHSGRRRQRDLYLHEHQVGFDHDRQGRGPRRADSTFGFTTTGAGLSPFSLDDDADGTLPNTTTFSGLLPGNFTVTENAVAGWALTGLDLLRGRDR